MSIVMRITLLYILFLTAPPPAAAPPPPSSAAQAARQQRAQQRSPPAYCRELHVGLRCASRSANGYAGAGGTQFLTKELQPVPPVEQSDPSVPASHTQVGEPSAR